MGLLENGTGGDSGERLRKVIDENGWSSWVDLTVVSTNLGFTGGNNLLIRPMLESADPPDYVLLLNSDTIVKEHSLDTLVEFMDTHPRAGIAGSKLVWTDGKVRSSPFRFLGVVSELDVSLKLGIVSKMLSRWGIDPPKPKVTTKADWVSGASMIIRRSLLEEIGLLDEGLYTYFDDVDICLRARRAGWETWYVVESEVIHLGGASTGVLPAGMTPTVVKRRPAYWFQARRRFFLKSYGKFYTALVDAAFIIGQSLWRLRGDPAQGGYRSAAMLTDAIRNSVFCTGFRLTNVENPALRT